MKTNVPKFIYIYSVREIVSLIREHWSFNNAKDKLNLIQSIAFN